MAKSTTADPDAQINSTILKLAEDYAASEARSANENEIRANIRSNVEKLGIPSKAWQVGVSMAKHMTVGERRDHEVGLKRVLSVLDEVAPTLWPEDVARAKKREERKAAEAAGQPRSEGELDAKTDSDKRSDPAAGGAKPQTESAPAAEEKKPETLKDAVAKGDAVIAANVADLNGGKPQLKVVGTEPGQMASAPGTTPPPPPPADEQAEGEAALKAAMPQSQSAQAAAKRAAAKLDG
jgi:hypothetical protein